MEWAEFSALLTYPPQDIPTVLNGAKKAGVVVKLKNSAQNSKDLASLNWKTFNSEKVN